MEEADECTVRIAGKLHAPDVESKSLHRPDGRARGSAETIMAGTASEQVEGLSALLVNLDYDHLATGVHGGFCMGDSTTNRPGSSEPCGFSIDAPT